MSAKATKAIERFRSWRNQRFGLPEAQRTAADMSAWFETPLGQAILEEEQRQLDVWLPDLFGYHLLQMSVSPAVDISASSRITHRVAVTPFCSPNSALSQLVADNHQLPLPGESVDLVILHHTLDFSQAPHQLLREAQRVLIPRGHLVIVGFNPWGSFGLVRWLARLLRPDTLWRHRSLRLGRLLDWLQLLDLDPEVSRRSFYRPPLDHPGALRRLQWLDHWGKKLHLPGGAFYMVVACKDVGGTVPVKPCWETGDSALGGLGVQPLRKEQTVKYQ